MNSFSTPHSILQVVSVGSRKTTISVVLLFSKGGEIVRSIETIMREDFEKTERHLRQEINSITKLLAALCEHVEKSSQATILITIAGGEVASWWGKHKKTEAERKAEIESKEVRRIARENEERWRKDTRDKILEKLTKEERKILGLVD